MFFGEQIQSLEANWLKMKFSNKNRVEFYETLILLLENRVLLNNALEEMYLIYSDDGNKPKKILALVARDLLLGVSNGQSFSSTISKWVGDDESALIQAGDLSSDLPSAFRRAIKLAEAKQEISNAIMMATVYPSVLMVQGIFLLSKVSTDLVPKLGRAAKNTEDWNFAAKTLKVVADLVTGYGLLIGMFFMIAIIAIIVSLPVLRTPLRIYLDKIPPWSIYRMVYGSTFLLNIGVLLKSGVKLTDALESIQKNAKPWLRQRIQATLYGVNVGMNLGAALHNAGYDFPDKRAVKYLRIISGRDGSEDNLERFGGRWMEESVKKIKSFAAVFLGFAILFNALLMIGVLVGANGIADSMQTLK